MVINLFNYLVLNWHFGKSVSLIKLWNWRLDHLLASLLHLSISWVVSFGTHILERMVCWSSFWIAVIKQAFKLSYARFTFCQVFCTNQAFVLYYARSKTHKRLKECFLIRRNRTKRANFRCNHLFRATYNTTENSLINLSLSVGCQEAGGRKRARDCLDEKRRWIHRKFARFVLFHPIKKRSFNLLCVLYLFFHNGGSQLCFRFFLLLLYYARLALWQVRCDNPTFELHCLTYHSHFGKYVVPIKLLNYTMQDYHFGKYEVSFRHLYLSSFCTASCKNHFLCDYIAEINPLNCLR